MRIVPNLGKRERRYMLTKYKQRRFVVFLLTRRRKKEKITEKKMRRTTRRRGASRSIEKLRKTGRKNRSPFTFSPPWHLRPSPLPLHRRFIEGFMHETGASLRCRGFYEMHTYVYTHVYVHMDSRYQRGRKRKTKEKKELSRAYGFRDLREYHSIYLRTRGTSLVDVGIDSTFFR